MVDRSNDVQFRRFYERTNYESVLGDGRSLRIRIGEPVDDLGCDDWLFITAWNPFSRLTTDEENAVRNARLERRLGQLGYTYVRGVGVPDDGDWKPEESFLVFGVTKERAIELRDEFEQRAVVIGSRGGVAELLWAP